MFRRKPVVFLSGIGAAFGASCLLKDYLSGASYDKKIKGENKVIIVTGANSGIGKATAYELASRGSIVYMACRNLKKCEQEREEIVLETRNRYVYCRECDLSSFESIRKFVDVFKSEQSNLHVLINNAGVMQCPKSYTKEGIEMQLGVNHMGHFLLTNLLLDMLKESAPSRIINVSSAAHLKGKINVDDLNMEKDYNPLEAYNQSKLANVMFTNELSTLLLGTGVTVNCVNPGVADTELTRHLSISKSFTRHFFYPIFWIVTKTPKIAAQGIIYAALDEDLKNVTGSYFTNYKQDITSALAKNIELSKWLWTVSEKWTRLKE